MAGKHEAMVFGDMVLSLFDIGVVKLFYLATTRAYEVIVVIAFVDFKNCLACVELAARKQASLFELRKHAVHGGQTYFDAFCNEGAIYVFSTHVAFFTLAENIKYFQPGVSSLETHAFQFVLIRHPFGSTMNNSLLMTAAIMIPVLPDYPI